MHNTGLSVDSRMSWAGDRHLTNILAKWVHTERFSSTSNCNFKFKQSFTARRKDNEFGLQYDGLAHRDINERVIKQRSFSTTTGYCNPEYTDEMMMDCIHNCMSALMEGDRDQKPVRNILFVPFQKGQLIHNIISTYQKERSNDIRPLIIFPPKTYPFWQLGYWFGQNKLKKTLDLCYNDGPLALITFDNSFARITDPIPSKLLNELTLWKQMKLPLKNADSIEWLNDFQSVKTRKPSDAECQDFNIITTRVESWITTPDSLENIKFCDIASLNAPQWMTDQLITG